MTLKVALLGAGRMGQLHYQNLLALPTIKLCSIYDPFLEESHANYFDKDLFTKDLSTIMRDSNIGACIIATPSSTHVDYLTTCLENGKDVFCEKPISFKREQLLAIKKLLEKTGRALQVGFNRRFDVGFNKIAHAVKAGMIGNVQLVKITNRDPLRPNLFFVKDSGGLFFDFNIHDFDALQFITGQPISEVYACGDALIQPELKQFADLDTTLISLRLKNGALASIDCSRETGYGYDQRLEVFGDKGMLSLPNLATTELYTMKPEGRQDEPIHFSFVERFAESYFLELKYFFDCIEQNKKPSPSIDDAIAALNVAIAAKESFTSNKSVVVAY